MAAEPQNAAPRRADPPPAEDLMAPVAVSGDAPLPAERTPDAERAPGWPLPPVTRPVVPTPAEPLRALQPAVSRPVGDGLLPRDLRHPSGMVERFGLLVRWFAWVFFDKVQFPARIGNDVAAVAREGAVVYALHTISVLDYLYLNHVLPRHGLPLSQWANGVSMTLFQPWRRALAGWFARAVLRRPQPAETDVLHGHLRRRHAVTVFLRRAHSLVDVLTGRPDPAWLGELLAAQRQVGFPIHVVPMVLVWQRDPETPSTSILDAFFGDPEAPGRLRKLLSFLMNYRRAHVQAGEPIDLQRFLTAHAALRGEDLLVGRLRFLLVQALKAEQRVIRGAPVKPPHEVRHELLADPEVSADLERVAQQTGQPIAMVRAIADRDLREIGADFRMWMVATFSFVLTLIWARIYEGIEVDEEGLDRVREAGRRAPVVIVPSHKSHIDYLVISYIFYRHGLIPPHIAAGDNLSFFPLGWTFRRAGAFFLRRSFSGAPIYAAAFRHYVRKLLKDGHWIEFFPEGGRSRTGKLLPPKMGLMRNVLEAVADGVQTDVWLMPTNFGYERLIEEKSYKKELEGGEKTKESMGEVLKATSILVHKYGRIRVQFGAPVSVRALLEEHGALVAGVARDPHAFDRAVKVAAWRVLGRINEAAVITPTALVAAVLLTKIGKGIGREDLLLRVGFLLEGAVKRKAVLSEPLVTAIKMRRAQLHDAGQRDHHRHAESGGVADPLGEQSERARRMGQAVAGVVEPVLQMFAEGHWVVRKTFDSEDVLLVKKAGRLHLDYYKNNLLHLYVPEALLAASLLALRESNLGGARANGAGALDPVELQEQTKFLSRLLKFEFVYEPGISFEQQYQRTVDEFCAEGWLARDADGRLQLAATVVPAVRLYAKLIQNFIESYWVVGRALDGLKKGAMTEKAFLEHVQAEAEKAFDLGAVQCYEAVSKVNLSNALKIFIEQGFVRRAFEGSGKKSQPVLSVVVGEETGKNLACLVERIAQLQAPWRADKTT
ncbi:MAG: hypothetical protein EXR79_07310 [Myxococcales bacterium]|nr:hypothetical protein [Myxococcales bacterium]